ncbi:MAG: lysine-sensitive aspartokinase 3 [Bacteroidota bacterium]|jgi:aspartate kinase
MIVMKFGGTSVEDAASIKRVVTIVRREMGRRPLVVVSACAGVTNDLIKVAQLARKGDKDASTGLLSRLHERHRAIIDGLLYPPTSDRVRDAVSALFEELRNLVMGVYLLGELTNRSLDTFSSYGERLSSLIIEAALLQDGLQAELLDARSIMITDAHFGSAHPMFDVLSERVTEVLMPVLKSGKTVMTQGFIGATEDGATTTIGRGGSDYSAAIFGAALGAEEIQIWTDVDGMMTADPRIVPEAKIVQQMSFDEASELAYFGAKVLHPKTILPAVQRNIPVRVLNSRRPELKGTLILKTPATSGKFPVKSIASKKGITLVNVSSSRMLLAHGFLARIFSIFADHQKSVDVVSTSEVSVSVTIDSKDGLDAIRAELEQIGETRVASGRAIICIVGERMKDTPGIAARVFGALARAQVNVEMVSEGASEINITLVVDEGAADNAVRVLHEEFFAAHD